jgi:hypothetical protein
MTGTKHSVIVAMILEYQSNVRFVDRQQRRAERTHRMEAVGPVRKWNTRPVSAMKR